MTHEDDFGAGPYRGLGGGVYAEYLEQAPPQSLQILILDYSVALLHARGSHNNCFVRADWCPSAVAGALIAVVDAQN